MAFYDLSFELVYDPVETGNRAEEGEEEDLCC